jgi:hypothetical protein
LKPVRSGVVTLDAGAGALAGFDEGVTFAERGVRVADMGKK